MTLKVEDFDPISNNDLREFWYTYRDKNVRRLILEIVRHRRVMDRARAEAQQIERGLRGNNNGQVVGAAQLLLNRLLEERIRLGSQGGIMIKLESDVQYRQG